MGNMLYARFRNTLTDLRDCQLALEEGALDSGSLLSLGEAWDAWIDKQSDRWQHEADEAREIIEAIEEN